MLVLLSPAKSLDYDSPLATRKYSEPRLLERSEELIEVMRTKTPAEVAKLMDISAELAHLNVERYRDFDTPFTTKNARAAVLAFAGDVYQGLQAGSFGERDFTEAQKTVRILSGLYGVLRPLDLMQPYRLEMGTGLRTERGKDLYAFWGERLAVALNAAAREVRGETLVNLASEEYFRAVALKKLAVPVIQPVFEDWSRGQYKVVSFHAKRARGLMARHVVTQHLESVEGLKSFAAEGYAYDAGASDGQRWVFRRKLL